MIHSTRAPRRGLHAALALASLISIPIPAQAQATVAIARIAVKDTPTFRYAQVFHDTGTWVLPDLGYIDYGSGDYREFFAGGGRTLVKSSTITLIGELYFLQSAGEASGSARYLLPWVLFAFRSPPQNILGEAVYFPYVPLNASGQRQHVLERAKVEYAFDRLKVGAGYGAYEARRVGWQHRPFVTMTVSPPKVGDFEVWLQRIPDRGVQLQLRYQYVLK
jgi:hypothetical protein